MDPPLLASGRAADVFDLGDGTVLRRYRIKHDTSAEARLMTWLHAAGYPVPRVVSADGDGIVMEKVAGTTMIEDLARRPWRLVSHARTMAKLQRKLAAIEAPSWLPTKPGAPAGNAVVHLDLHPFNVMLTRRGPVVIDWTNATRSTPEFDAAMSYVLMTTADSTGRVDRFGRRAFLAAFRLFRGPRTVKAELANAARYRMIDPNVTPAERARLAPFADSG